MSIAGSMRSCVPPWRARPMPDRAAVYGFEALGAYIERMHPAPQPRQAATDCGERNIKASAAEFDERRARAYANRPMGRTREDKMTETAINIWRPPMPPRSAAQIDEA